MALSDPYAIQFDPRADLWIDVEVFESRIAHEDLSQLAAAVALCRGELLEGSYDDWIVNERYRLETLFCDGLVRLMAGQEAREELAAALSTALRLLRCDPVHEDAHRLTMRAYCRLGRRNAALEQYRRCRQIVQQELGVEPMAETTDLYHAILQGRFAAGQVVHPTPPPAVAREPAISPGHNPLDAIAPSRLVGREQELDLLNPCWQRARASQGGLVLVSGEAVVGKTRLAEEFAHRLCWLGIRVLWGRCYEFERILPHQPIAEALRCAISSLTPAAPVDLAPWAITEVARLVPEVGEHYPALGGPAPTLADQEQERLFDGVVTFLRRLSSRGALLLVVEDLRWASESTLHMLHYLVRHLYTHPVLLLGALRTEATGRRHPLAALQRRVRQEGLAQSLPLPRLSPEATEALVMQMSGVGESILPLAARLYRETAGNPFFLIEMESLCGPQERDALAGELAHHFEQGQAWDKALAEKAIHYLLEAGDQARLTYAHHEAIDYYQRAPALLKKQGDVGRDRAARTLMKLGLTCHTAFDFGRSQWAYEQGFDLWRQAKGTPDVSAGPLPPAPHALRVAWSGTVATLDPTMCAGWAMRAVVDQRFSGLVELSPGLEILPNVARAWDMLAGGSKYLFRLRDQVRRSGGAPVTAGDFESAWKRVLDPVVGSPNAGLLFDIKGARAFDEGAASEPDQVGVRTLDETTLLVELDCISPSESGSSVTASSVSQAMWQRRKSRVCVGTVGVCRSPFCYALPSRHATPRRCRAPRLCPPRHRRPTQLPLHPRGLRPPHRRHLSQPPFHLPPRSRLCLRQPRLR